MVSKCNESRQPAAVVRRHYASFLVKCEIPLFYDKHVEVKFSDRAGPGSHNGYTRGFPTNGVYTLELQMESAHLSSTTDESRVQLMSLE